MSDPLSDKCAYCGSMAVLDDAWFCHSTACWAAYENECRDAIDNPPDADRKDEDHA